VLTGDIEPEAGFPEIFAVFLGSSEEVRISFTHCSFLPVRSHKHTYSVVEVLSSSLIAKLHEKEN